MESGRGRRSKLGLPTTARYWCGLCLAFVGPLLVSGEPADRILPLDRRPTQPEFHPSRLLVRFRAGAVASANGTRVVTLPPGRTVRLWSKAVENLCVMDVPEGAVQNVLAELADDPTVLYAEPDYKVEFTGIPNDPDFGSQWALLNTGQTVDNDPGLPGADMGAIEAWDLWTGDPEFRIAVTDTGINWAHPDLAANIWTNPGEIAANGIDDDQNGWIDDIHGYSTFAGHGSPFDTDGHGTHIAGVIGAASNNGSGIAGLNWHCQLVALKVGSERDGAYISAILEAIDYILAMDIRVSNNSWGCYQCFSQSLFDAIEKLERAGHIFIAAAGNGFIGLGTDNDRFPFYPASYDLANIVAVASINNNDRKPKSSNYGLRSVEIGAPGVNIYSTYTGTSYAFLDGTSMATAQVTGVVGLMISRQPDRPWQRVLERLVLTARPVNALQGRVSSGGVVDVLGAVGDCNRNGVFDEIDIAGRNSADCNDNGVPDECEPDCNETGLADGCDIESGLADDCDANGIPDECEPDCNDNQTTDACDIAEDPSGDCNSDAIPDECQFGFDLDCNANGVDDLCDLANEAGTDCNENGVPDACDIANGFSGDCTGNGLPDECERDCNENGIADTCDVQSGVSEDADGDGVPDECSLGFAIVPVGALGEFTIADREIAVARGGNTVTFEILASGWDPDQDGDPRVLTFQVAIDTESFDNGTGVLLALAEIPCANNEDCLADTECVDTNICERIAAFSVDEEHPNYIFSGWDSISLSDVDRTRLGGTLFDLENVVVDRGVAKYLATLILDVPSEAAGSYTIRFRPLASFLSDELSYDIPIAGYLPATITILPDCNGNGIPDPTDIANETSEDCDHDGVPDECISSDRDCNSNRVPDVCDIDEGFSLDCNYNGIPDDCSTLEVDCNRNTRPDECDIADRISSDCNGNGIPDECFWLEEDCNHNRQPDACDISRGVYEDCNGDGILDVCQFDCNHNGRADECDIEAGISLDLEGNGVPDECQRTLRVPTDYPTIQAGIDAAQRGDLVLLEDGTYTGPGNHDVELRGKILTVRGKHGRESCIIDAIGQTMGIGIFEGEDHRTILEGLTIRRAWNAGLVVSQSSPTIRNCTIEDNGPTSCGVLLIQRSAPLLENCLIRRNSANVSGGGIRCIEFSHPTIRGCLITDNYSGDVGGGVFGSTSDLQMLNSTITDNSAVNGGGGIAFISGHPVVHACVVAGNRGKSATGAIGDGGGINALRAYATIADTLIEGNLAGADGGGVYFKDGDTRLINCTVVGNRAQGRGGGVLQDGSTRDTWACCRFEGCVDLMTRDACERSSGAWYPGLDCADVECGTQSCCLGDGSCANLSFFECLVAGGEPHLEGTQCISADCLPTVSNSIIWHNRSDQGLGVNLFTTPPLLTVMHSIVPGSWPGQGNTFTDPTFMLDGGWIGDDWVEGEYHLRAGSVGVNSGRNDPIIQTYSSDLDGRPRVLCGQLDRGAYERGIGDINCDGAVDHLDFREWGMCLGGVNGVAFPSGCEAFDFDSDGDIDLLDFGAFQNLAADPSL